MNCKRAKRELALHVGHDADGSSAPELRRHMAACPSCHRHWQELQFSLRALQSPQTDAAAIGRVSLWPEVSAQLPARREPAFNGWVPALAVAAACVVVVAVSADPYVERTRDRQPIPVLQADGPAPAPQLVPTWPSAMPPMVDGPPHWERPDWYSLQRDARQNHSRLEGSPRVWPAGFQR